MYAPTLRELNVREDSDFRVELLWSPESCNVFIRVTDKHEDSTIAGQVPNEKAAHAFDHPFLYVG